MDQYRRAQDGRFMATTLRALRAQVGISGQRHVVIDELPMLSLPTLLIWAPPTTSCRSRTVAPPPLGCPTGAWRPSRLGHVPHVEDPARVATVVRDFLATLP